MFKLYRLSFLSGSVLMLLSGCSHKYPVVYNSNPSGADVVCHGINYGQTPLTLYTNDKITSNDKKNGYIKTIPCSAQWVGGATENYATTWDLNKFPDGVMQTLERPDEDNYEKAPQFPIQVPRMTEQQRQEAAAKSTAVSDAYKSYQLEKKHNYMRYDY